MKKGTLLSGTALAVLLFGCEATKEGKQASTIKYPTVKKVDTVDVYYGTEVPDPYRWLEDDRSEETSNWVQAQNDITQNYLSQIPYREEIQKRLTEIWDYPKSSAPFKEGKKYYRYKNNGLQNQYVLYVMNTPEEKGEVFLDPNNWSEDGTASLGGLTFSKDGKYAAYAVSESGSDWRTIRVIDTDTKEVLKDEVKWVKCSGISWAADGFFYSEVV